MGNLMTFRLYRGRLMLALSIMFDRWSWRAMQQAKRDFAKSVRPAGDLFDQDEWGRGK